MKLSELLAEAGMKLWKEKEGCDTFHSQARRCIEILNDPKIKDIDTKMVDLFIEGLEKVVTHRGTLMSPSSINHNISVLCTLLRYAKQRDYIDKLPYFHARHLHHTVCAGCRLMKNKRYLRLLKQQTI